MELRALLAELDAPSVVGDAAQPVRGIAYHSRDVQPGFLFAAFRGLAHDGLTFVAKAAARGATAIVVDRPMPAGDSLVGGPGGPAIVRVADARRALAQVS